MESHTDCPPALDHLFYVDDSGHPQSGRVVYGWVSMAPFMWREILGTWLDHRTTLWREFGIPVTQELHTVDHVNGRGRVSQQPPERYVHDGDTYWKDLGRDVAVACLEVLSSMEGLSVGSVYATGAPADLALTRAQLYQALLEDWETTLEARGSLGLVFVDGDGTDSSYRATHRRLPRRTRRIIEDPVMQDSRESQLIQIADLVAWSANAAAHPHPRNAFAHDWYARFLAPRDPRRHPQRTDLGHS